MRGLILRKGMYLTHVQFWILNIWFLGLSTFSGFRWASIVLYNELPTKLNYATIAEITVFTAVCVSSVYYIRKLYRDKFAMDLSNSNAKTSSNATVAYFLTRPLFAVIVALFFNFTLCGIVESATLNFQGFGKTFFIHLSASAALISVITGNSIRRLENLAS